VSYLYAAYAITWLIHLGYIGTLVRRYSRLRREMQDLKRNS
jgi:CcmD family protein